MAVWYNENDAFLADWLENLIEAGEIAPGVVDRRSIWDVCPADLEGFSQCHFFAGIGIWSYALRQAGWRDDRPVWTFSAPCQPFSEAGKGLGFADERHLFPAFWHQFQIARPPVVFGEQVASKDAVPWLACVRNNFETASYAFGAVNTEAPGFGAPCGRSRLYFVADAHDHKRRAKESTRYVSDRPSPRWQESHGDPATRRPNDSGVFGGFWRDHATAWDRDGGQRGIERGTCPVVTRDTAKLEQISAYGNALNAEQAIEFIYAYTGYGL